LWGQVFKIRPFDVTWSSTIRWFTSANECCVLQGVNRQSRTGLILWTIRNRIHHGRTEWSSEKSVHSKHASLHHSPHLRSDYLSFLTSAFHSRDSSVSQILSSIVFPVPFGLPPRIFDTNRTKWALHGVVCFSFFFIHFCFWPHSALQSMLKLACIVSYSKNTRKPSYRWQTRAMLKHATHCSNSTCLLRCRWQYWPIFIRSAVVASEIYEIPRNSLKIQTYGVQSHPRSSILVSMESPCVTSY